MSRPEFITNIDISRWDNCLEQDKNLPKEILQSPIIREVCYAGLYLSEQLESLQCPDELIVRIQFTAGKLSYGRDIWEVHQQVLQDYKDNKITFADSVAQELN